MIRSTGQAVCLVVYTGTDTKIMQNLGKYSFKRSEMEKRIQLTLMINVFFLFIFVTVCTIWNFIVTKKYFAGHYYITDHIDSTATQVSLQAIVTFFLLFNYIIPLDLAVMVEFNAVFYTGFITNDAKMTHVNEQMRRIESAKTNTLNLLENLGEVEYILSDKTGTLTQNELTFVAVCSKLDSSYLMGKIEGRDEGES